MTPDRTSTPDAPLRLVTDDPTVIEDPTVDGHAEGHRDARPQPYAAAKPVLGLACGATFLALLDATVVNVAFGDLARSFPGVSITGLSWVITAYAVAFAALLAAAGRLADAIGRRRLFAVSVLGFTLTSAAAAAAPDIAVLVVARGLQGACAAGMIPAALGLLLAHTPPARRAAAIGAWGAVGSLAAAVGPGLGGLVVQWWDWRGVFLVNVPLGAWIVAGTLRRVPTDTPSRRRMPDPLASLALVVAIGAPVLAVSQGDDWGWNDARVLGLLAGGLLAGVLVAVRSARHPVPAFDVALWRDPTFAAANLTSALFGAALFAWLLACPLYLAVVWDYSVLRAGLGVTPGAFTAAAGAVLVGRIPLHRQWVAVAGGAVLCAGSFAIMGLVLDDTPSYALRWLPPGLVGGFGIGCVLTGLSSVAAARLRPRDFASGTGMLMTSRQVGGALGVAGLAVLLQDQGATSIDGYLDGFLGCGIVALLAGLAAVAMRTRGARRPAPVDARQEPTR